MNYNKYMFYLQLIVTFFSVCHYMLELENC